MEYILTKFRIKKGTLEQFRSLFTQTHSDHHAFEEGLKECGVSMECQFIESSQVGDFFYVFKRVEDNEKLKESINKSPTQIHHTVRKLLSEYLEDQQDLPSIITSDPMLGK